MISVFVVDIAYHNADDILLYIAVNKGWQFLNQFFLFYYFLIFLESPKHRLSIVYDIHIWQMSPHPSF